MFSRHSEKLKFGRKIFGEVGTYRISAKDEKVVFFFLFFVLKKKKGTYLFTHEYYLVEIDPRTNETT